MANKIPNIDEPQMTTGPLSWLRPWLGNLRLWARTRDPQSSTIGDPLDKFVSRRELVDLGLMIRDLDGSFGSGLGTGAQAILLSDQSYASGARDVLSFTLLPRGNPVLFIASAKYTVTDPDYVTGLARVTVDGTRSLGQASQLTNRSLTGSQPPPLGFTAILPGGVQGPVTVALNLNVGVSFSAKALETYLVAVVLNNGKR